MVNTFGKPIIPPTDEDRINKLASYNIVGTPPETYFNNMANMLAQCFETPIALISLVDKEDVYFKANVGMEGTDKTSRGVSLCALAILDPQPTIFEDALKEPCLLSNPLVAGEFGLRFYAGAPLITPEGHNIGAVCIVDKKPREFSPLDEDLLTRFASTVMEGIIDRKEAIESGYSF